MLYIFSAKYFRLGGVGKPKLNILHDSAYFWISPDGPDRSDFDVLLI